MSARADFRKWTLTNSGLSDFISNGAEHKERFLVTHEQRNHAFWRVKTGIAPTAQSTASEPKAQAASRFKRPSLKLLIAGLVVLVVLMVGIPRFSWFEYGLDRQCICE